MVLTAGTDKMEPVGDGEWFADHDPSEGGHDGNDDDDDDVLPGFDDTGGGSDGGETGPSGETYETYEGHEEFVYAWIQETYGTRDCELYWNTIGTPSTQTCDECEFLFDVELLFEDDLSTDNGTCWSIAEDRDFTYGFAVDIYGYGLSWAIINYYSYLYAFAYAEFEDNTFLYSSGFIDYYYDGYSGYYPEYAGYYFTRYTYGIAHVE